MSAWFPKSPNDRHLALLPGRLARPLLLTTAAVLAAASLSGPVRAQAGTVDVERENFRAAPSGTVLAEVMEGTRLGLGEVRERWREATLEGWIWAASVRDESSDGHDLVVSARSGENLRASPNGEIIARLRSGMRLERVEAEDRWIRVRRRAWIWEASLRVDEASAVPPPPDSAGAVRAREWRTAGSSGAVVLENPTGDTLGRVASGASVEVLGREGEWTRIRVEGWTFSAALATDDTTGAIHSDIPTAEIRDQPERWRGRLVEWRVQFIALQRAERFRTDLLEGEPFMLTRGPGEEPGFVYVAIPQDQLAAVERLSPLQWVRVMGRLRTPESGLTGSPVLELLELRPSAR